MINKVVLPKTLQELSITNRGAYPIERWSGAVCMLVVEDLLVFIKRSDSMPSHKGQIGFMGGHKHDGEIDPIVTALRELHEEANILADQVEVIGIVDPVFTSHKKIVIPVLCKFKGSSADFFRDLVANEEWDEMILTPLEYLANVDNWQIAKVHEGDQRLIGFCPLRSQNSIVYPKSTAAEFLLWGASAKMVWNFFNCYE